MPNPQDITDAKFRISHYFWCKCVFMFSPTRELSAKKTSTLCTYANTQSVFQRLQTFIFNINVCGRVTGLSLSKSLKTAGIK